MFTRIAGVLPFGGAAYLAWARLPAAYLATVKLTGASLVTRSVVDRLATIYLATGAVGGFGLALIVLPLQERSRSSRN